MSNLFGIFDPVSVLGLNLLWLSLITGLILIPSTFWPASSYLGHILNRLASSLNGQFAPALSLLAHPGMTHWAFSIFIFIMILNSTSLLPYVFSPTAHLSFTLSLGLSFWLGYFFYAAARSFTHSLAHLIPDGTPAVLQPFMALVETISSLIRPATLSIRLAANMVAGHLLIALLTNSELGLMPMLSALLLLTLESLVALVQAYVFVLLSILYISESNAHSSAY